LHEADSHAARDPYQFQLWTPEVAAGTIYLKASSIRYPT
jgi:hypothetical protein